jgi:hypothetical protein
MASDSYHDCIAANNDTTKQRVSSGKVEFITSKVLRSPQ